MTSRVLTKYLILTAVFILLITPVWGQDNTKNTKLSSKYDLISKASNCKDDWRGRMCDEMIQLFRKSERKPFQSIFIRAGDQAPIFGDFDFDGYEDIAISDGMQGAYVTPSYRIYLYSRSHTKFIFDSSFTALSHGEAMGFFDVDRRTKTLTSSSRVGCCYFWTRTYDVYRGKPRIILELIRDESSAEGKWAVITTKKLIGGKWRTWKKRERLQRTPAYENTMFISDTDFLISALETSPGVIIPLIREVPADILKRHPSPGTWSAYENAVHLSQSDASFRARLDLILSEPEPFIQTIENSPEDEAGAMLDIDLDESLERYVRERATLVERLKKLSPNEWHKTAMHEAFDHYSVFIMFRHLFLHEMLHAYRIEQLMLKKDWD